MEGKRSNASELEVLEDSPGFFKILRDSKDFSGFFKIL